MTHSERHRLTVYGCGPDEAVLFRRLAPRLGLTPALTEAPASAANSDLAAGSRCVSVGHRTPLDRTVLRALGRAGVAYVSTRSIGRDHIDVAYAESIGITVGSVSYSPDSVADYTLMLMLMALRDAKSVVLRTAAHDYRLSATRGRELRDLTVGVLGTGRIGTAVIRRLRGFGCRVLAHDPRHPSAPDHVPLDQLLRHSDLVTLHVPLATDTRHLLNAERLARMKPGALVVNTGRGALVDTEGLLAALESGRLGGAALDVLEGEEDVFYTDRRGSPPDNRTLLRLHELPNVLLSPHTAYYTDRALRDTVENSLLNCLNFESGKLHA